jgi:hypothetical protein
MEHKQEILSSRIGGFGGSDSKLFYKIATKGLKSLSETEKRRIAIAKGLIEPKESFTTKEMQRGHDFEEWYDSNVMSLGIDTTYEKEYKAKKIIAENFDTFAHCDFFKFDNGEVLELKCVKEPDKALDTYYSQLQWYYMLGACSVILVVFDANNDDFNDAPIYEISVTKDDRYINTLLDGINILDETWDSFEYEPKDVLFGDDLSKFERNEILEYINITNKIKALEAERDEKKEYIKSMIEMYGVGGLELENSSINYVHGKVENKFDEKLFFKENPTIDKSKYTKESIKASYITLKIKQP